MSIPPFKPDHRPQLMHIMEQWHEDTAVLSSIDRILAHPNAQLLIDNERSFPNSVVSLIMHRFAWGHVYITELSLLPKLTNARPWPDAHQGHVYQLATDWLDWYRRERIGTGPGPA